jgi:sulfur-carrier protein
MLGEQDYSHNSYETPLPDAIVSGKEPFLVVGAMAGGRMRQLQL